MSELGVNVDGDAVGRPALRSFVSSWAGYGIAVLSVALALLIALGLEKLGVPDVAFPLMLLAIALTAWFSIPRAAIVALLLACLGFNFFFTRPFGSLVVSAADIPFYIAFTLLASLVAWFSATRRRIEEELRSSRDLLRNEVAERTLREQEIRTLNDALAERSKALQATNQELEAFAYSVSHDLRAPTRHIVGFTELLLKGAGAVLSDRSRQHAAMILESAQRMGTLVDDLLEFSRIGRVDTRKTMVGVQQIVQEAMSEVARQIDGRDIEWRIGPLPLVYADRAMLRVVLVNLISNAVKFTGTRARAVIEIGSTEPDPEHVVIRIRDNGVGFDMKYVGKLFGVFQRLHAMEAFEGTGIGLATVQRVVHRHGGRIWAEAAIEQGATFYFSLPKSAGATP